MDLNYTMFVLEEERKWEKLYSFGQRETHKLIVNVTVCFLKDDSISN